MQRFLAAGPPTSPADRYARRRYGPRDRPRNPCASLTSPCHRSPRRQRHRSPRPRCRPAPGPLIGRCDELVDLHVALLAGEVADLLAVQDFGARDGIDHRCNAIERDGLAQLGKRADLSSRSIGAPPQSRSTAWPRRAKPTSDCGRGSPSASSAAAGSRLPRPTILARGGLPGFFLAVVVEHASTASRGCPCRSCRKRRARRSKSPVPRPSDRQRP